jgi:hypothetical protein
MPKQILFVASLLLVLSCKSNIYKNEIDRSKFCDYFSIVVTNKIVDGKNRKSSYTKISKNENDKVSDFIQSHHYRFD